MQSDEIIKLARLGAKCLREGIIDCDTATAMAKELEHMFRSGRLDRRTYDQSYDIMWGEIARNSDLQHKKSREARPSKPRRSFIYMRNVPILPAHVSSSRGQFSAVRKQAR